MPVSWFVRQLYPSTHRSKTTSPPAIERVKSGDGSLSSSSTSSSIPTSFLSRKRRSAMSSDRALGGGRGVKGGPTSAEGLPRPKPGIGRDARDDDLWRVENILDDGKPPAEADWWIVESSKNNKGEEDGTGVLQEDSSMKEAMSQDEGDGDSQGTPTPQPPQETKTFHNCGLSNWEKARAKWRAPPPIAVPQAPSSFSAGEDGGDTTASETTTSIDSAEYGMGERRQPPPPVRYDDVVRGLTQVSRTFELPGRMTLPDIVDVFVDIWECEKDY